MSALVDKNGRLLFGAYAATETSPHRKSPTRTLKTTDTLLDAEKRKKGTATFKEAESNESLLGWMVRKHINYVSRFEINFRSGDAELDRQVNGLLDWHGRKKNFDVTGRFNRNEWMGIYERNKVVNGDALGIMLGDGRLQGIDSSQLGKPQAWDPKNPPPEELMNRLSPLGLVTDDFGAVEYFCICRRNKHGRLVYDHFEPAANVLFDGYFTEFSQTRAPSPLLTALNDAIDLGDIRLFTKINLKLKNIFGMAVLRSEEGGSLGTQEEDEDGELQEAELSADQVNILDLGADDDVKMVESSNTPSGNSMEFMNRLTQAVMLCLDIPFTSFDSSRASFSARIGDRSEYEKSAESKREKNSNVLQELYANRVTDWYNSLPDFKLATDRAGWSVGRIVRQLDIIPTGAPWMDKLNEVKGDILSVALGIESIPRIARKRGLDAYDVGKEQYEYLEWAKENKLPIFYASGGQPAVQSILEDDDSEEASDTGDGDA